ncbi:MAG: hypothetical protein HGA22_07160, partial [Clostridiales bacterium]|nr:hypothetical protein [Clostridiales bacterium]
MNEELIVKTREDLRAVRERFREKYEGYSVRVLVCSGAGCISSNCRMVRDALEKSIAAHGLSEKARLVETGCIGTCALGPVIVVETLKQEEEGAGPTDVHKRLSGEEAADSRIMYVKVLPEDAEKIVATHLVNGIILTEKTLFDNKSNSHIPYVKDMEFFKNQVRIALRNCGTIDHSSLEEYVANDGYEALSKALCDMS